METLEKIGDSFRAGVVSDIGSLEGPGMTQNSEDPTGPPVVSLLKKKVN